MRLRNSLVFGILIILASCNGQNITQTAHLEQLNHSTAPGDTVKKLGNNIMVVYQDRKDNYWFGSWQEGLYKYDGHAIIHFTTKDGLPHKRIEEIKEDKIGNIYINTPKGISKFDGTSFSALKKTNSSDNDWKLIDDALWFKCFDCPRCVYQYDGSNLYRLQLPKTKLIEDYFLKNPNHVEDGIYTIYKDTKGNIWFGTNPFGVCRYDGKSFDWISEQDVTELHNGPANGVRAIAEDKNGNFWFNTEYCYNVYNNKQNEQPFYSRMKSIGSLDGKPDSNINEYLSITKDNDQNLWIATYRDGVWKYDGKNIVHYPVQMNAKDITLFYIYKDNKGVIWLGTHENGAFKFNGQTFERFKL